MVAWRSFRKLSALAVGTGAGLAVYYYQRVRDSETVVHNSWTNCDKPVNPSALWDKNWDFRDPQSLVKPVKNDTAQEENRYNSEMEKVRPTAVRHIILVRHGEYLDTGDKDHMHHLTQRGCLQADYTGKRLHEMGLRWDSVIVSTMVRAQETANIILANIDFDKTKVQHCHYIREGAPIPPQPPVGHWRPAKAQFFVDGSRIEAGFRQYFHRAAADQKADSYTLMVGHANVIRYYVCRALQLPPEAWLRININHASITWLAISPSGNVSIKYLGDTGFIPAQYLTNRIPRHTDKAVKELV